MRTESGARAKQQAPTLYPFWIGARARPGNGRRAKGQPPGDQTMVQQEIGLSLNDQPVPTLVRKSPPPPPDTPPPPHVGERGPRAAPPPHPHYPPPPPQAPPPVTATARVLAADTDITNIATVAVGTGTGQQITNPQSNVRSGAAVATPVPTMTEWQRLIMILLVMAVALTFIGRIARQQRRES